MKLVKESLNFERGLGSNKQLDIGKEGSYSKEQVLQKIRDLGVKVFDSDNTSKVLENIYELEKMILKLLDLQVKPEDIELSNPDSICVTGFTVKDGNMVLLHCLTFDDANIIVKTMEKFMIDGTRISIDRSSLTPFIRLSKENNWMKDLKENRKNFNKLIKTL